MKIKTPQGFQVLSSKGKPLSKPNLSSGEADKRLEQVEYFKHKGLKAHGK